jgi:hypothetical protein
MVVWLFVKHVSAVYVLLFAWCVEWQTGPYVLYQYDATRTSVSHTKHTGLFISCLCYNNCEPCNLRAYHPRDHRSPSSVGCWISSTSSLIPRMICSQIAWLTIVVGCWQQPPLHGSCVYGPRHPREHSVNLEWTLSEHSVNIQWTFSEHSVNIQWTFSEHSVNIQWTFRAPQIRPYASHSNFLLALFGHPCASDHSVNIQWTFRAPQIRPYASHSNFLLALFGHPCASDHSVNIQWTFSEHSVNIQSSPDSSVRVPQ